MAEYECMYKAAIALNNTGVYLIQHGRYIDAITTLKDAMSCTKQYCNGSISPCTLQTSDCDKMIQAARTRTSGYVIKNIYRSNILVVSDQDNPSTVYSLLKQNPSACCCVTIDPVEQFDIDDIDQLQLESALIVYNFGIAYRCISNHPATISHFIKSNDVDSNTVPHHDAFWASVKIMELTRHITRNLLQLSSYNMTNIMLNVPSSLLLTALMVSTNLLQMSSEHPLLYSSEKEYCCDLTNVLSMLSDRERFLTAEGYQISVAVAA